MAAAQRLDDRPKGGLDDADDLVGNAVGARTTMLPSGTIGHAAPGRARRAALVLAMTGLLAGPGFAADPDPLGPDQPLCDSGDAPARDRAEACTRGLDSPSLSPQARAGLLFGRSQAHDNLGEREAAASDIDDAIRLQGRAAFFEQRAHLRRTGGDAPGAIADYGEAIRRDPDALPALRARADLLIGTGRFGDAIGDLDAVLRLAPDDGEAYRDRGLARWRALTDRGPPPVPAGDAGFALIQRHLCAEVSADCEDVGLALADLGRAIDLLPPPERADALLGRSRILAARGKLPLALDDDDEALRLRPADYMGLVQRAEDRRQSGQRAAALADLDEALRLRPDNGAVLLWRAKLRQQAGDLGGARADLDQVLHRADAGAAPEALDEAYRMGRAVALPGEPGMERELSGLKVVSAVPAVEWGEPCVSLRFDDPSARRLAAYTAAHVGSEVRVLIGGRVVAEPRIMGPIPDGTVIAHGSFTHDQAADLASMFTAPGATVTFRAED